MASGSIFTFDTDPQRVSSPWLIPDDSGIKLKSKPTSENGELQPGHLSDYGVTKLEAEPQEGPTEYKLHLLLRPRRIYTSMSTIGEPAPHQSKAPGPSTRAAKIVPATLSASSQSRQVRLQQLTTQLLWRLQQSCAYHALNPKDLIVPKLPDDTADLTQAVTPQKPLAGLEESRGALYEIGVADDGTLVGLTKDEMDESITTLRVMAATLGCRVEILRHVIVGECEWLETSELVDNEASQPAQIAREARLWVVEALVTPDFSAKHSPGNGHLETKQTTRASEPVVVPSKGRSTTDQLRITLTGPTTSGKTTLLGTLSTGTLDNGRGNSRTRLFKHRHEVASGLTSSVAQELIGYKDHTIFNFSQDLVASWIGVHDSAENGRLVFVSDSAGHPRYRRTILRGLIGWAPQWTVLCLASDDADVRFAKDGASSTANEVLGTAGAGVDLAKAHLELCLKLKNPLIIVITKLDLATKMSLHRILGQVMTHIKEAGRVPKILQPGSGGVQAWATIPSADLDKVRALTTEMEKSGDLLKNIPIVLTSAVSGAGIGLMHALLENLPLPPPPTAHDFVGMALNPEQPSSLFHVDDTFSLPASYASLAENPKQNDLGTVVSGYLRFGQLSVGDSIVVGPFPAGDDDFKGTTPEDRPSPGNYGLSISHPSSSELAKIAMRNTVAASTIKGEWHKAQIVSIRNLRLPVHSLEAGQVGTIGIVLEVPPEASAGGASEQRLPNGPRIRKGMVLAIPSKHMADTELSLQAASGLTASFNDPNTASLAFASLVNVYVGSVRANARVTGVTKILRQDVLNSPTSDDPEDIFSMNEHDESHVTAEPEHSGEVVKVTLELLTSREWIEMGSQILVLEGGRNDKSGLEGFVGTVVEIVD